MDYSSIINSIGAQGSAEAPQNNIPERENGKLQREANNNRTAQESAQAVYKEYQENIKKCTALRAELRKGTAAGEDITTLYLKAIRAISLMVHDDLFYTQIEKDIRNRKAD